MLIEGFNIKGDVITDLPLNCQVRQFRPHGENKHAEGPLQQLFFHVDLFASTFL